MIRLIGVDSSMKRLASLIFISLFILIAIKYNTHLTTLIQWVKNQGILAPLLFIALYCLSTILVLPGLFLTLAGGALFGPLWGTLINLIAATCGATCAFLIARYWLSDWVKKKASIRVTNVINEIDNQGWVFVAFIRLVPIIPFNIINFLLGVTNIRLTHYIFLTLVFMLPAEIAYTYAGFAGTKVLTGNNEFPTSILILIALLALITLSPIMFKKFKKLHSTD
jgi:uncharacterized membrane protein YdjX (TVP38/TMEM64 family)